MSRRLSLIIPFMMAMFVSACATPPGSSAQLMSQAATSMNGSSLNGVSLNGISLNGASLNGTSLNGVSLNGASLNGASLNGASLNGISLNGASLNGSSLNGVSLNGASLNGASLNGVSLNGASLNGASLNGTSLNGVSLNGVSLNGIVSDGTTVSMTLDMVTQGTGPDADVFYYAVSYVTKSGSVRLCGSEQDGSPVMAIALAGRWNYNQGVEGGGSHIDDKSAITFACMHTALAKCVGWGYKPWTSVNGVSVAPYHQACTRMVRADYCGDGVSWTQNGEMIDFFDGLAIQTDTQPTWRFEAEFTTEGARCISKERVKNIKTLDGKNPMKCIEDREDRDGRCGDTDHFDDGTKMMVRHPKANSDTSGVTLLPH